MAVLASFMEAIEPVGPCTLGEHVFQRFEREPNTLALAVVDSEGRPVGLVERNGFFLKMASHYGRALYARRRVETFMDSAPLVAEAETTAESFFRKVMAAEVQSLLHGFIVTRNGLYAGVGTALAVLQAGFALHRQRAEEMTRLAENLAWAETEAKAALRAKNQFLAVMSHEIRTPLNGFGAMIDLLHDSPLSEDQRENLRTMDACARSLLRLVTDILDYSKFEAGKVAPMPEPTSLARAMNQIVDHFRAAANERGIDLIVHLEFDPGVHVNIDLDRTRQVMANLIGNAIKFTEEGMVSVRISRPGDDALAIDVLDTGPGISVDGQSRLFEPFVQADSTTTRRYGGTGLGLAISRQVARAIGGDVRLTRSDVEGTSFRFTLRAPACEAPAVASAAAGITAPQRLGHARVLVVDDDPTNQRIAARMLDKLGLEATVVADGQEALDITATTHFDLILMDMMMPRVDGLAATRCIRGRRGPSARTPILAFTAAAFDTDREAAKEAGMNGFLEKPVRMETLRRALLTHLAAGAPTP
jgi:two-component system, sensor histidine kinase